MSNTDQVFFNGKLSNEIREKFSENIYIGIDFGTSTTVVSMVVSDKNGFWHAESLQIPQEDSQGGFDHEEIVNSVLLWKNEKLLFGAPAYKIRATSIKGRNYFSSFKMDLGIDVGPTYPDTLLSKKNNKEYIIEDAKDATSIFFTFLVKSIKEELRDRGLFGKVFYAVSVPASFLITQRNDLIESISKAGIKIEESSFIDEPNAAFLSYFYECWKKKSEEKFFELLKNSSLNILVYDFGAGTCDISILNITLKSGILSSKNIAISKFTALGGDNIDRSIAKNVLLEQIEWNKIDPEYALTNTEIEEIIIPRLMPIAEQLKIQMVNWIKFQSINSIFSIKDNDHVEYGKHNIKVYKSQRIEGIIKKQVELSASNFYHIMSEFLLSENTWSPLYVCSPIYDAIEKAGIDLDDLYAVLFIGGSCENPLVRNAVMSIMPDIVKEIIPYDLRTHVSKGAAIHSLGKHAIGVDFIQPVTSEDINLVISGSELYPLVQASTPVPSKVFKVSLAIVREGQKEVEIPICLSSIQYQIGKLMFKSSDNKGFLLGESVDVVGKINHEKLLEISAFIKGAQVDSAILSPLSINSIAETEEKYLKAKKIYQTERLNLGRKDISVNTILKLISAAEECKYWKEVVDLYIILDNRGYNDYSTSISYFAEKAGNIELSRKYAKIAVNRDCNKVTAYNYSLQCDKEEEIFWLKKSLSFDENYVSSILNLARALGENTEEGSKYLQRGYEILENELKCDTISERETRNLINISNKLNKEDTINKAREKLNQFSSCTYNHHNLYNEYNLLGVLNNKSIEK